MGVAVAVEVDVSAGVLVWVGEGGGRVDVGGAVVGDGDGLVVAVAVCACTTRETVSGVNKNRPNNTKITSCTMMMIDRRIVLSFKRVGWVILSASKKEHQVSFDVKHVYYTRF